MPGNIIDSLIPEWDASQRKKGQSYTAACETIRALTQQGKLEQMDAALCELLLSTAVDIDSIAPGDAASGRAAIRKTYLGILGKLYEVIDERERATNSSGNASPQERVAELLHIVS